MHPTQCVGHVCATVKNGGYGGREIVIRVNALETPWGTEDLLAACDAEPDAILVPKVMIELKETRLADEKPGCRLERIKLDLTDRALRRRLFSNVNARAGKILLLTEGVSPYLTNEDVAELADDLRQAKKIGFWITDYFSPEAIRYGEKIRAPS